MRIAVDFDGTLVRSGDLVCRLINFRHGTSYTTKEWKTWSHWKDIGLDKTFWEIYDLMDSSRLRLSFEPYDTHVVNTLRHLQAVYAEVDIVTSNSLDAKESIEAWLRLHMEHPPKVRCLGRTKPTDKLALGYDLYIDDAPALAERAQKAGVPLLLPNCRWNESVPDSEFVKRFHSWSQVPRMVADFQKVKALDAFSRE
jgi:hypothetical protein